MEYVLPFKDFKRLHKKTMLTHLRKNNLLSPLCTQETDLRSSAGLTGCFPF